MYLLGKRFLLHYTSVSAAKCDGHDVKRALSFVHGQDILAKVTRANATSEPVNASETLLGIN